MENLATWDATEPQTQRYCLRPEALTALDTELDVLHVRLLMGQGTRVTQELMELLDETVAQMPPLLKNAAVATCRQHPIFDLIQQDPCTSRAFKRPRGYAGDPIVLDYLHDGVAREGTTALGRDVFRATTNSSFSQSIVDRVGLLAGYIDRTVKKRPEPRVLSLGCGYLREAERAKSMRQLQRYFAVDGDPKNTAFVQHRFDGQVTVLEESVASYAARGGSFSNIDFAYAANALEATDDATAKRIVEVLFASLRPGGRLLVSNFTPTHRGRGYMEAFMGWTLVRRDRRALMDMTAHLDLRGASRRAWDDPSGNVAYLEIERR